MTHPAHQRSVAAIGDVADVRAWSGIPFHFLEAAQAAGFASIPWRLDLRALRGPRVRWSLGQLLRGRRAGGFQYSAAFMKAAGAQVPEALFASEIITFHQHFPPCGAVKAAGGRLNHYIDATFAALASGRGLDLRLPSRVVEEGRQAERENYRASAHVVTMARWTAESAVIECGVPAAKVAIILPGANFSLPPDAVLAAPPGRVGRERDFVLGFVGMDWQRKGLPFMVEVRDLLAARGWRVKVQAAGAAPQELADREGVNFVGQIDKSGAQGDHFFRFLKACDIGCLFSRAEALGISTLEFLRAGVPVAGFAHQGLADTLPPDAGFRFPLEASAADVADTFEVYLRDEAKQEEFRHHAQHWSPLVTWERCVAEMQELWQTGSVRSSVCPWLGLENSPNKRGHRSNPEL